MKRILIILALFINAAIFAQDYKFGKVSKAELEEKSHPTDSTAKAAFLFKHKKITYKYSGDDGWKLFTEVHERVKLYSKEGFDYGTREESIYLSGGKDEKVTGIKGITYTLVNGKIKKDKLSRKAVFREKSSKDRMKVKFTMPNLTEGAIVEWKYQIESPYHTFIDDIVLQHNIPIKKLDILVKIPEYYTFNTKVKGFLFVDLKQQSFNRTITYSERSRLEVGKIRSQRSTGNVKLREKGYIIKTENIPALKSEPFVNNINNYRSTCQFELLKIHFPGSREHHYSTTWEKVSKTIFDSDAFGGEISKQGHYKDELTALLENISTDSEKIVAIYQFVKSKIKWNNRYGKYPDLGTRKSYKEQTGNVADINLNLVSMLRFAGLNANPVLVSTRSNGISLFPTLKGFNYVISKVDLANGAYVLLDATEKYGTPNILPERALNWNGRVITKEGISSWVKLTSSKLAIEDNTIFAKITDDLMLEGLARTKYSNLNALNYRNKYNHVSEDDLISKFEENNTIEVSSFKVVNKEEIGKPINRNVKFTSEDLIEEINGKLYLEPLLFLTNRTTPFKLKERKYPVDFATPWQDKNTISIQLPEGYKVESLPATLAIGLPESIGVFKYQVSQVGNKIRVLSVLQFNEAVIAPHYYDALKDFYSQLVKKQSEKIVLVKQ